MNTNSHYCQYNQGQQSSYRDTQIFECEQPKIGEQNKWTKLEKFLNGHHSICFCFVLFLMITLFGVYLWQSHESLKVSQQKVLESYNNMQQQTTSSVISFINQSAEHRKNLQSCVDRQILRLSNAQRQKGSLTREGIFIKLYADIEYMRGQNEYITKIATDSLSQQYRELSSMITSEKMLELHLDKIEHEYTNITIWAAVLTIIFLVFSFFSLFKIEQSRKEIEELRDKGQINLESSIVNLNDIMTQSQQIYSQMEPYKSRLDSLIKQYEEIIAAIQKAEK